MYLVKKDITYSVSELCSKLNGKLACGDADAIITSVGPIEDSVKGDASFIDNTKYAKYLSTTKASAVIVKEGMEICADTNCAVIEVKNSYFGLKEMLELFYDSKVPQLDFVNSDYTQGDNCSIATTASVSDGVVLGKNCVIYPGCYIAPNVKIGNNVTIYANVSIGSDTIIGDNVIVYANTTIGSDGFGYVPVDGKWLKMFQVGNVIIEDDVEIGANVTIDRAALKHTKISKGTKIDNLVQIAHNVEVNEHSVIAAQSGVSGSTKIGKNVVIAGQVGLAGHLNIGDGVFIGAKAGLSKDIPAGESWTGYPARPFMEVRKSEASVNKLKKTFKELKALIKRVDKLEDK